MRRTAVLALLILLTLPGLTGCGLTLGPVTEREVTWAKMGTPGRVTDAREVDLQVPDGKGGWRQTRGSLKGMCVIDEPTLDFYRNLYERTKGGALKTETPEKKLDL